MFDIYDCWHLNYEYRSMQDQWIRECHIFIFVYSITSLQTFEEIEILIEKVRRTKEDMYWFGIIVGNKCDLDDQREVTKDFVQEFLQDIDKYEDETFDLKFYETSAKDKINEVEIFHECARLYRYGHNLCNEKVKEMMSNASNQQCIDRCSIM